MKLKLNKPYLTIALILFLIELWIAFFIKTGFIRYTFGDYLVVILMYVIIRGCTNLKIWTAALFVLVTAYGIELLQLTSFLSYFNLEDSFTAKLIFGSTFSISDLVAYTLGVVTVLFFEAENSKTAKYSTKLTQISTLFKAILSKIYSTRKKLIITIILICMALLIPNYLVAKCSENKTYYSSSKIPKNKVGLVLGAGKYTKRGTISLYYKYRVEAAAKLFKAKKIDYILASGDNGVEDYDEPTAFKNDLIALGIPEHKIFLDYAGFRTLDSVIRAKAVFGETSVTIISQRFHNQRAIYLAQHHGINAVGFNAKHAIKSGFFNKPIREYFARTKAVLDIIFNVQPKFFGKKVKIK